MTAPGPVGPAGPPGRPMAPGSAPAAPAAATPLRPRTEMPAGGPVLRPVPREVPPPPWNSPAPPPPPRTRLARLVASLRPHSSPVPTVLGALGSVLVLAAVVVLGWSLWESVGSRVVANQGQVARAEEFVELSAASAHEYAWSSAPAPTADPGLPPPPEIPAPGPNRPGVVGRLRIPAIELDELVAVGTEVAVLNQGPGLWEPGVFPGAPGNATIAGHRNTYGSAFYYLDRLAPGDRIYFEAPGQPVAVFEVRASAVVDPSEVGVTAQGPGVRLTLTTCTPIGTARQRLIVQSELVEGAYVSQALPADQWAFRNG